MDEEYDYKGHQIHVWTEELKGKYCWVYTIDGNHLKRCTDRALENEGIIFAEGKTDAESRIDWVSSRG